MGVLPESTTLPKTSSLHLAGGRALKGNSSEPTPVFQVRTVSFKEGTLQKITTGSRKPKISSCANGRNSANELIHNSLYPIIKHASIRDVLYIVCGDHRIREPSTNLIHRSFGTTMEGPYQGPL